MQFHFSEAGTERPFSTLKHRYPDRRNRSSHKTIMNKIHIEQYHQDKLNASENDLNAIWNLPPILKSRKTIILQSPA